MHVICYDSMEFRDEILFKGGGGGGGGECKTPENSNFLKNHKMIISIKIQNFYKSRMMKRTSLLESSQKI